MKRSFLILGILIIALLAGWSLMTHLFAKHSAVSSNSGPLLLINQADKTYTFSAIPGQPIPPGFQVIGPATNYTDQQLSDLTKGMTAISLATGIAGSGESAIPTTDQAGPWQNAVATLTPAQQALCASITQPDLSQYCIVRHLVLNAIIAKKDKTACAPIFVDSYRTECEKDVTSGDLSRVLDANHNGLIDSFEPSSAPNSHS